MHASCIRAAAMAALFGLAAGAQAQSLKIALASEPTAMDPHYHQATPNNAMASQIFETLVAQDAKMSLVPGLATSWKNLDDLTWELKLREGVKFSNGEPFTSQDVLFSVCRTLNNKTNISQSYMTVTKLLTDVQTPDAHTVILKTAEPFPLMPAELARQLPIIWNGIVEHGALTFAPKEGCGVTGPWPTVADFNSGKDAIGTGPHKR
ncbi:ABC transporter substrate-binding protein, partial [Pseudomonas stutzeri]|nr:ABC transporter substrate-binding protein [Stutzerimonas stutzeri]